MAKTMEAKPLFDVSRGVTTMAVKDADGSILEFNANRVGPMNYWDLRVAQYGPEGMNFDQLTFGQLTPLAHAALTTRDTDEARAVMDTLRDNWMTGRTIAITGKEGLWVDDNSSVKTLRRDIAAYEQSLKRKLGGREEAGIVYSDDKTVRFTPYGFAFEEQSTADFAKNKGLIALVGSPERAEMLAQAVALYERKPWLGTGFAQTKEPQLRVPGVDDFVGGRLGVVGYGPVCDRGCSFGVRVRGEAAPAEKKQ